MATTKLGKPTGAMVFKFTRSALLAGVDEGEVEETLNRWLDGSLEVPFTKDELVKKQQQTKGTKPMRNDVLCAACLAACCWWTVCDPGCMAACAASACA